MFEKKDPGKFTVRFNPEDPQQRAVIDLLNKQGRYKAQFLTSAILHYVHCSKTPDTRSVPVMDGGEIERIVRNILAEQQKAEPSQEIEKKTMEETIPPLRTDTDSRLGDADRAAIFQTLNAFQKK